MTAVPYARRQFPGGAVFTTVPNGIGLFDASCTLFSGDNWPSSAGGDFYVGVDFNQPTFEKILCSGTSGLVLSFAAGGRGADGTTAVEHAPNCQIFICSVGQDDDEANQVVSLLGNAASGSLFVGAGASTLPSVLPVASTGRVLTVVGGTPAWAAVGSPSMNAASIEASFTAAGQLYAGTGSGSGEQLATGTTGQFLTVGGADASGLEWASVFNLKQKTTTYAALPSDYVQADGTSGAFAVTVPITVGTTVVVQKIDSTEANTITITPASGTINGAATLAINDQYQGYMLYGDGTNLNVIGAFGANNSGPFGNTVTVTGTYTAKPGDVVKANGSSGGFTITIPLDKNAVTTVVRTDTVFTNTITLTGAGTSRFDGGPRSIFLYGVGAGWSFQGDGTNPWYLNTIQGQWQNYTPTWASTGTQPAIGNGTVAGAFFQDGNLLWVQAEVVPGSTSTFGTGNYAVSLPIAAAGGETPGNYWGTGQITGTTLWPVQVLASSTSAIVYAPTSSTVSTLSRWAATVPVTFSTSFQITFGITYSLV